MFTYQEHVCQYLSYSQHYQGQEGYHRSICKSQTPGEHLQPTYWSAHKGEGCKVPLYSHLCNSDDKQGWENYDNESVSWLRFGYCICCQLLFAFYFRRIVLTVNSECENKKAKIRSYKALLLLTSESTELQDVPHRNKPMRVELRLPLMIDFWYDTLSKLLFCCEDMLYKAIGLWQVNCQENPMPLCTTSAVKIHQIRPLFLSAPVANQTCFLKAKFKIPALKL